MLYYRCCTGITARTEDIAEQGGSARFRRVSGAADEGDRHFGKASAAAERRGTDGGYAIGNRDLSKRGAVTERVSSDRRHTLGNDDGGDFASVIESVLVDLVRISVAIIGENELGRTSLVSNEIIGILSRIENESVFVLDELSCAAVHFLCVVSDVAVAAVADREGERGLIDDLDELLTTVERVRVDRLHTARDFHAKERAAVSERLGADRDDTVGNLDLRQGGTAVERAARDRRERIGDGRGLQAHTAVEDLRAHARHAVRNVRFLKGGAVLEYVVTDRGDTASEGYAFKSRTAVECVIAKSGYRVGKNDFCKRTATVECIGFDRRYAHGKLDRFQSNAVLEEIRADRGEACGESDLCKRVTGVKCVRANARHAIGNHHARQAVAIVECVIANARHGFGNRDRRQAVAVIECVLTNRGDRFGKCNTRQHGAILECIAADKASSRDRHGREGCGNIIVIRSATTIVSARCACIAAGRTEDITERGGATRGGCACVTSNERNRHFDNAATACERTASDFRYAFGNGDLGKTRAFSERIGADGRHGIKNLDFRHTDRLIQDVGRNGSTAEDDLRDLGLLDKGVIGIAVSGMIGKGYEIIAMEEDLRADGRYRGGNRHFGKTRTAVECTSADRRHVIGKEGERRDLRLLEERAFRDRRYEQIVIITGDEDLGIGAFTNARDRCGAVAVIGVSKACRARRPDGLLRCQHFPAHGAVGALSQTVFGLGGSDRFVNDLGMTDMFDDDRAADITADVFRAERSQGCNEFFRCLKALPANKSAVLRRKLHISAVVSGIHASVLRVGEAQGVTLVQGNRQFRPRNLTARSDELSGILSDRQGIAIAFGGNHVLKLQRNRSGRGDRKGCGRSVVMVRGGEDTVFKGEGISEIVRKNEVLRCRRAKHAMVAVRRNLRTADHTGLRGAGISVRADVSVILGNRATAVERIFADGQNAFGNDDFRQSGAVIERSFADGGHTVTEGNARHVAVIECAVEELAARNRHARESRGDIIASAVVAIIILIDRRCAVVRVIAEDIAEQGVFRCRGCIGRAADERNREARKTRTAAKRAVTDGGHVIGNDDGGKSHAALECELTDELKAFAERDARKTRTTGERIDTHHGHAVGNDNGGKTPATGERAVTDFRHTVRHDDGGKVISAPEGMMIDLIGAALNGFGENELGRTARIADEIPAVLGGIEGKAVFRHNELAFAVMDFPCLVSNVTVVNAACGEDEGAMIDEFNELDTIVERLVANARHTAAERYRHNAFTVAESIFANGVYAVGNDNRGQAVAIHECAVANARHAFGNRNGGQGGAPMERILADGHERVSERYVRQSGASVERIAANARHAFSKIDLGQHGASVECIVTDRRHAFSEVDLGQHGVSVERAVRNASAGNRHARKSGGDIEIDTIRGQISTVIIILSVLLYARGTFPRGGTEDITEERGAVSGRCIRLCIGRSADERNGDRGKTRAACERARSDFSHAIGNDDFGKTRTALECVRTNADHAFGNDDRGELASVRKRTRIDRVGGFVDGCGENELGRTSLIADEIINVIEEIEDEAVLGFDESGFSVMDRLCVVSDVAVAVAAHGQLKSGVVDDLEELGTIVERAGANARHAVGDRNRRKGRTASERIGADRRYAIGNLSEGQGGTVIERTVRDRGERVGDDCAFKSGTAVEDLLAHARHAVRDHDRFESGAMIERIVADRHHAVLKRYACKRGAITECIGADRGNIAGDRNFCECGTAVERAVADRRHALTEGYARKRGTTAEGFGADRCHGFGNFDRRERGTAVECGVADGGYAVGDRRAHKRGTAVECGVADRQNRFGNRDLSEGRAGVEHARADRGHTRAERYARKRRTAGEDMASEVIHARSDGHARERFTAGEHVAVHSLDAIGDHELGNARITERVITDGFQGASERHGCKLRATHERAVLDIGHAISDRYARQSRTAVERLVVHAGDGILDHNLGHLGGAGKNVRGDVCSTEDDLRDGACLDKGIFRIGVAGIIIKSGKIRCISEDLRTDGRYAFGDRHLGQCRTSVERAVADRFDALGDRDLRDLRIAGERACRDRRYTQTVIVCGDIDLGIRCRADTDEGQGRAIAVRLIFKSCGTACGNDLLGNEHFSAHGAMRALGQTVGGRTGRNRFIGDLSVACLRNNDAAADVTADILRAEGGQRCDIFGSCLNELSADDGAVRIHDFDVGAVIADILTAVLAVSDGQRIACRQLDSNGSPIVFARKHNKFNAVMFDSQPVTAGFRRNLVFEIQRDGRNCRDGKFRGGIMRVVV